MHTGCPSHSIESLPTLQYCTIRWNFLIFPLIQGSRGTTEVAVKIFEQYNAALPDSATELTKNYSDMRYELNKLSSLAHPYIVRFIGVFTNPHSFVLEWAPRKSLEHLRIEHVTKRIPFCPTSIFLTLLQVMLRVSIFSVP